MTLAADVNFTCWMASIDGTRTDSERQCWPPAWPNGSKCTERAHRVAYITEHKVLKTEKNKKCLNYAADVNFQVYLLDGVHRWNQDRQREAVQATSIAQQQ